MSALFVYGTLRHPDLLRALLGRIPAMRPATLDGYLVRCVEGEAFPGIFVRAGAETAGDLLLDLSAAERAVLDRYEAEPIYQYAPFDVEVRTGRGARPAIAYRPNDRARPGADWSLTRWAALHGVATARAAVDYMRGTEPPLGGDGRPDFTQLLMRAHSRDRAETAAAPARLRRGGADGAAVQPQARSLAYARHFGVTEEVLRIPRFDGGLSAPVLRAALASGDAVTVLPYDPVRDRVLVIEQFRYGPHLRGDPRPWVLEPVAGRIDPGESPEQAARRELAEEAGLDARRLIPLAGYYPSPGTLTEYLFSYVALCDLGDDLAGRRGGMASEHEDILCHLMSFAEAMALVEDGEADCAPLLISLMWLAGHRAALGRTG